MPDSDGEQALFLSSARFHRAFWRCANTEDGSEHVQALKQAFRRGMKRRVAFACFGAIIAVGLIVLGWRPWPN